MGYFRKKPVVVKASQWLKNGDHPEDYARPRPGVDSEGRERWYSAAECRANGWEGDVVRYYRDPEDDGQRVCEHCGRIMHDHGWIDTLQGGHVVCPGDWIITDDRAWFHSHGYCYPCKPDIFAETYEPAEYGETDEHLGGRRDV